MASSTSGMISVWESSPRCVIVDALGPDLVAAGAVVTDGAEDEG